MTRSYRLLFLVFPLALGLGSMAMPGRAQQAPRGRFAFADTTLLRDTLGISFEGLFPLADSLGMPPDTLRALSIRYRYTLGRLVLLADSLGVAVDSVGPVLLRERFNPLAGDRRRTGTFAYNTTYRVEQYSTTWINGSDYVLPAGPILVTGTTSSQIDRRIAGGRTNLDETRSIITHADWKSSPNLSVGAVASLARTDNRARGSIYNQSINNDDLQLSVRSRQKPARGLTSELNFSSGLLDVYGTTEEKRGLQGNLNGRLRYIRGTWFTHDASGQISGNVARTRAPGAPEHTRTQDVSSNLRGTLGMFSSAPVALNANYNLRDSRVETPGDSGVIQQVRSGSQGIDLALRLRRDNDRYVSISQRLGSAHQASATSPTSQNSRSDQGLTVAGRYGFRAWSMDAGFGQTITTTEYPRRGGASGGYGEDLDSRSVNGTLAWSISPRLSTKAIGSVSLTRSRYFILGTYPNPPVPRDQYRQSYRVDGQYSHSQRFNTGLGLEVSRSLFVNIPAASTAANSETRGYRADWRWTFLLLSGLTATQRNQLTADYTYYTFLPASSNRLSLDYFTQTRLNAVITPRLRLDVTHDHRYQPSGGYAPLDPPLDDGNSYFSQADDNQTSSLRTALTYSPAQSLSLTIAPDYTAFERRGVTDGVAVPQRTSKTLNFSGGANLNVQVGRRGQLTGNLARTFRSDNSTTYVSGVPSTLPSAEIDYWRGDLQFSWSL